MDKQNTKPVTADEVIKLVKSGMNRINRARELLLQLNEADQEKVFTVLEPFVKKFDTQMVK